MHLAAQLDTPRSRKMRNNQHKNTHLLTKDSAKEQIQEHTFSDAMMGAPSHFFAQFDTPKCKFFGFARGA